MNRLKYIFILSLIALFASCAKDDEISMGSLKIGTQVTNITTTSVLIDFTLPANAIPLNFRCVLLYDGNGNPVSGHGNYYGDFPDDNAIETTGNEFCIIEDLNPNTTYTYKLVVEEDQKSVNNGSDNHYWGKIILSDQSYTFTTGAPSVSDNILSASITSVQFYYPNVEVTVRLNTNLYFSGEFNVYVSETEGGLDYVSYNAIRYNENEGVFVLYDLKPDTKYYMTIKGDFYYNVYVNEYVNGYFLDNVTLQLTPNYFETPNSTEN